MSAGEIGGYVGAVLGCLWLPAVWLIACKLIPPLRRRPGLSYSVAAALAVCMALLGMYGGGRVMPFAFAAVLLVALLAWQYRRARLKAPKPAP